MSENSRQSAATPLTTLARRLFIFRAATILSGAAAVALAAGGSQPARAQADRDPTDPAGGGRGQASGGNTNSDPTDVVGYGKASKAKAAPAQPSGPTDSDPTDRAGQGKGAQNGGAKWCADSDPTDKVGQGKSC